MPNRIIYIIRMTESGGFPETGRNLSSDDAAHLGVAVLDLGRSHQRPNLTSSVVWVKWGGFLDFQTEWVFTRYPGTSRASQQR